MAAATAVTSFRGRGQFQGLFTEMWTVKATWDPASAAAGAQTTADTLTVPGVAAGDIVIGLSLTTEIAASPLIRARVTAADTVVLAIIAGTGVTADMGSGELKMVIVRPAF